MKHVLLMALLAFSVSVFAGEEAQEEKKTDAVEETKKADMKEEQAEKKLAEMELKKTESGVEYIDLVEGTGKECKLGSQVDCHYTLWFADENGEKKTRFQSSKDGGKSFQCTLGQRLIQGWSDGMVGMKEGGTRLLRVSPELGYGKGGGPIPANATLIFEIDFLTLIK